MPVSNLDTFIKSLEERAKELNCLYKIEELLSKPNKSIREAFEELIDIIPTGFQYIPYCEARIVYEDLVFSKSNFEPTRWKIASKINDRGKKVGYVEVYYTQEMPNEYEGPFLKEERRLIDTIAERIAHFVLYRKMKKLYKDMEKPEEKDKKNNKAEWQIILDLLRQTDKNLFSVISRKMIIHLFTKGIKEAAVLFARTGSLNMEGTRTEINKPSKKQILQQSYFLSDDIFNVAMSYLSDEEILELVLKWTNEAKTNHLVKIITNNQTPINEIADAIRKYINISSFSMSETHVTKGTRVSLIRKFLSDQLEYINIAKNHCRIRDFDNLLKNLIFTPDSQGKLGGKAAGLFLAKKIIESNSDKNDLLRDIVTPKTWYMTSDSIVSFIYYNNLEDIIEQKYKDINDIRSEYSYVVQAIKNSTFPPELLNGLSRALDDFGENPIIVRSSSLLEDRLGAVFAGKYKSLFLANQGSKQDRLDELCDAVAEVFASVFGPDPIGYRIERGLLDFNEEMGIMIQEVVGTKAGDYFFPAFAGVAFSFNEFRWSPRIKREDGLIRLVPGLGTRAVDRISNDYPILISPGKPNFRLNLTFEQMVSYSPKLIDLINLKTNTFETLSIDEVIKNIGHDFPMLNDIFSIRDGHYVKAPVGLGVDTRQHDILVTFDNMLKKGKFVKQLDAILKILKSTLSVPIDIEFAFSNGKLYLLQSRPQSETSDRSSDVIPKNVPKSKTLFSTTKYVTNGNMPPIDFIVYVSPDEYSKLEKSEVMKEIGKAIGKLNRRLPKRTFILLGPGRWGSRGDIRLGVPVSYTDINNTSMLIEIAKAKGNYVPDLSFGTHFFQDLVESNIKYLPLYPDDETSILNEKMLNKSDNQLSQFLPDMAHLEKVLKVINIPESYKGKRLRVLMNADKNEAIAFLAAPNIKLKRNGSPECDEKNIHQEPWELRMEIAERIAAYIKKGQYGLKSIYLFGTVFHKNASAGSDIDLLVHYDGQQQNLEKLKIWFEAWNYSLNEMIFNQTGLRLERFIDVIYITDDDLIENDYFANLIDPNSQNSKKLILGAK